MNAKEMKAELPRIEAEIRRLQSSMKRLLAIKKRVLRECPSQYLTEASPIITSLANGRRDADMGSIMGLRLRSELRPVLELLDSWDGIGISQVEARIEALQERRDMILESLPSNEEIAEATQRLETMRSELREKRDHYVANWQRYIEALESAVSAARAVVEAKPSTKLAHNINALMDDFAIPGPHETTNSEIDRDDLTLAVSLTHLLVQVSSGQAYDLHVDKEVRNALAKRVKQAA